MSSAVTYIRCAYEDKEAAKARGARWDGSKKSWYVPQELALEPFARWLDGGVPSGDAQYTAHCDSAGVLLAMGRGWWHCVDLSQVFDCKALRSKRDLCAEEYERLSSKQRAWYTEVNGESDLLINGAAMSDESYLCVYKHGDQSRNLQTGGWARCFHCGGHLVAIGHAREGGADHDDWGWRQYHKKCWKKIREYEQYP